MPSILQELEEFLSEHEVKGTNPFGFYTVLTNFDGAFHDPKNCPLPMHSNSFQTDYVSLQEVLESNSNCGCLEKSDYYHLVKLINKTTSNVERGILNPLKTVFALPHWEEVKNIKTLEGLESFGFQLDALLSLEHRLLGEPYLAIPLNWAHHNRGYPQHLEQVIEGYSEAVSVFLDELFFGALLSSSGPSALKLEPGNASALKGSEATFELKKIYHQQLENSRRVIFLNDYDPAELSIGLIPVLIKLEAKKLNPQTPGLFILPPLLAEAFKEQNLNTSSPLEIDWLPTKEDASTAYMLIKNGATLKDAFEAAKKLRT